MPSDFFLQLRLVGNRFEDHAIPLDFLTGLAPLQALLVEAYKIEYLRDNVSRKRAPRDFTDSIKLKLTSLTRGIVQFDVGTESLGNSPLSPSQENYLVLARDRLIATIQEAEKGESMEHSTLSKEMLPHFEKIANAITDSEEIHLVSPPEIENGGVSARFSRHVANRLMNAASTGSDTIKHTEVRGSIPELNQASMTLQILSIDGDTIEAPVSTEYFDSALKVFNGFRRGSQADFHGIGRFDPIGRVLGFTSLSQLKIIESPSDISLQLDTIRELEDGWLDGDGLAPSLSGIDWIESRLHRYLPADFPRPYLYPTESGGVQLEWSIESNEISIEVTLESRLGVWHQLNLQSKEDRERELNLEQSRDWEWIFRQINSMRAIQ